MEIISPGSPSSVSTQSSPLLTLDVYETLSRGMSKGLVSVECSFDLQRSREVVDIEGERWRWRDQLYSLPEKCKDRTIYYWNEAAFEPISRYGTSLIKLVPTQWGAPTFEIDGIKMLPTSQLSPFEDARRKVALIQPRGKRILDTCGGLGYFAAWCLAGGAAGVISFEKNPDVVWLRSLNPWSPDKANDRRLELTQGDVTAAIEAFPAGGFDAVLHDPPRFGIAGELYSQDFYGQLARVLKRGGRMFHYVGTPNKLTSGRDVPAEVSKRLKLAGFSTRVEADGLLAIKP